MHCYIPGWLQLSLCHLLFKNQISDKKKPSEEETKHRLHTCISVKLLFVLHRCQTGLTSLHGWWWMMIQGLICNSGLEVWEANCDSDSVELVTELLSQCTEGSDPFFVRRLFVTFTGYRKAQTRYCCCGWAVHKAASWVSQSPLAFVNAG